jgi:POT family proton-dependent oligopeptide transporter
MGLTNYSLILLCTVIAVPFFAAMLYVYEANPITLLGNSFSADLVGYFQIILLLGIVFVIIQTLITVTKVEREQLIVVVILTFFMTIFWSFFELGGSALTLFAERNVSLPDWLGAAETNSINPMFIILFAFPFSFMWAALSKKNINPYTPVKFGLGIVQLGIGFFIFAMSANYADAGGRVPFIFLVLGYLFITTGELFMSPVGLSKVTELSVAKVVAFMMGVWFLSSSFAHYVAGQIAQLTAVDQGDGEVVGGLQSLTTYTDVFQTVGYIAVGFGVFALLLTPLVKRWMHGVH